MMIDGIEHYIPIDYHFPIIEINTVDSYQNIDLNPYYSEQYKTTNIFSDFRQNVKYPTTIPVNYSKTPKNKINLNNNVKNIERTEKLLSALGIGDNKKDLEKESVKSENIETTGEITYDENDENEENDDPFAVAEEAEVEEAEVEEAEVEEAEVEEDPFVQNIIFSPNKNKYSELFKDSDLDNPPISNSNNFQTNIPSNKKIIKKYSDEYIIQNYDNIIELLKKIIIKFIDDDLTFIKIYEELEEKHIISRFNFFRSKDGETVLNGLNKPILENKLKEFINEEYSSKDIIISFNTYPIPIIHKKYFVFRDKQNIKKESDEFIYTILDNIPAYIDKWEDKSKRFYISRFFAENDNNFQSHQNFKYYRYYFKNDITINNFYDIFQEKYGNENFTIFMNDSLETAYLINK
jgi:hypothetical protein